MVHSKYRYVSLEKIISDNPEEANTIDMSRNNCYLLNFLLLWEAGIQFFTVHVGRKWLPIEHQFNDA